MARTAVENIIGWYAGRVKAYLKLLVRFKVG